MPLVQQEFNTATDPAKVAFGGGSFAGVCPGRVPEAAGLLAAGAWALLALLTGQGLPPGRGPRSTA